MTLLKNSSAPAMSVRVRSGLKYSISRISRRTCGFPFWGGIYFSILSVKTISPTVTRIKTFRVPILGSSFLGGSIFFFGTLMGLRVLIHYFLTGNVNPYLPSAVLSGVLFIIGFQVMIIGLIADMIGTNRRLMEEIIHKMHNK